MRTQQLFAPSYLNPINRVRNEARIRALCMNAYLGGDTAICRVLGRYKIFVDTQDVGVSVHLLLDGFWEMWLTEALAGAVAPGMTAIDVGANLGYYAVLMADLVGQNGVVHAFEPNPAMAKRLRQTCVVNGYESRLKTHETALGDENGARFRLIVPESDPKNGFLAPVNDAVDGDPGILTTRRLDSFPELLDVDIVKIDADAAERMIWHGMRGIFDRGRPMTVFLEFNAERYRDPAEFIAEIQAEGFSLSRVTPTSGAVACSIGEILRHPPAEDQILMLVR